MSVLINMEMPKNCCACPLRLAWCIERIYMVKRPERCPLVPVPPHGDLIDRDALNYTMLYKENWMNGTGVEAPAVWKKDIDNAPTIIPASEEAE